MDNQRVASSVEWTEILDGDDGDHPSVALVYRRKGPAAAGHKNENKMKMKQLQPQLSHEIEDDGEGDAPPTKSSGIGNNRRQSWICRSLCTRGRKSIAFGGEKDKGRRPKKKNKSRLPNKRVEAPPIDFIEEKRAYFEEVDSFKLDEEDTPSPKHRLNRNPSLGGLNNLGPLRNLLDVVWEDALNNLGPQVAECGINNDPDLLSHILQTPPSVSQASASSSDVLISSDGFSFHRIKSSKQNSRKEFVEHQNAMLEFSEVTSETSHAQFTTQDNGNKASTSVAPSISESFDNMHISDVHKSEKCKAIDEADLSTVEDPFALLTSDEEEPYELPAFDKLLKICGQKRPMTLFEAFSEFCDPSSIIKIGEGTFGEAFKGGGNVFKIVPVDGDFLVNGEVQKTCAELFTEVLLSKTLNCLRYAQDKTANNNSCMNFIETKEIRICEGTYDAFLMNAWENWDEKHSSENDHPMAFPEKQLYVTFILADGGQDLESFVLSDYDEARSLLMQVTSSLAIAEAACEFEHRDLHWGNILLSRDKRRTVEFILHGKQMEAQTFGLSVAIIDFTLSRINTGYQVLYLDLSADPALFDGPKRDTQAETYRRMLNVTGGNWEGRYPKTNSLWLHYVADTLLAKKAFKCSSKDKRALQAFRKRLLMYDSAEAALLDTFFDGMWVEN